MSFMPPTRSDITKKKKDIESARQSGRAMTGSDFKSEASKQALKELVKTGNSASGNWTTAEEEEKRKKKLNPVEARKRRQRAAAIKAVKGE